MPTLQALAASETIETIEPIEPIQTIEPVQPVQTIHLQQFPTPNNLFSDGEEDELDYASDTFQSYTQEIRSAFEALEDALDDPETFKNEDGSPDWSGLIEYTMEELLCFITEGLPGFTNPALSQLIRALFAAEAFNHPRLLRLSRFILNHWEHVKLD